MLIFLRTVRIFSSYLILWLWSHYAFANSNATSCSEVEDFYWIENGMPTCNLSEQMESGETSCKSLSDAITTVDDPMQEDIASLILEQCNATAAESNTNNSNDTICIIPMTVQSLEEQGLTISEVFEHLRPYIGNALPYLDTPVQTFFVTTQALRKFLEAVDYPIPASLIGLAGSSTKIIFHWAAGKEVTAAQHLDFWENLLLGVEANILYTLKIEEEVKDALEKQSKIIPPKRGAWFTAPLKLGTPIGTPRRPEPLIVERPSAPLPNDGSPRNHILHPTSSGEDLLIRPLPPIVAIGPGTPEAQVRPTTTELFPPPMPTGSKVSGTRPATRRALFLPPRERPSLGMVTPERRGVAPSPERSPAPVETFSFGAVLELHVQGVTHLIYVARVLRVIRYSVKFLLTTLGESTAIAQEYPMATPLDIMTSPVNMGAAFPGLANRFMTATANIGNNVFKCVKLSSLVAFVAGYKGAQKFRDFHKKINDPEKPRAWNSPEALKDITLGVILTIQAPLTVFAKSRFSKFSFGTLLALEVFANYWSFKVPDISNWFSNSETPSSP